MIFDSKSFNAPQSGVLSVPIYLSLSAVRINEIKLYEENLIRKIIVDTIYYPSGTYLSQDSYERGRAHLDYYIMKDVRVNELKRVDLISNFTMGYKSVNKNFIVIKDTDVIEDNRILYLPNRIAGYFELEKYVINDDTVNKIKTYDMSGLFEQGDLVHISNESDLTGLFHIIVGGSIWSSTATRLVVYITNPNDFQFQIDYATLNNVHFYIAQKYVKVG